VTKLLLFVMPGALFLLSSFVGVAPEHEPILLKVNERRQRGTRSLEKCFSYTVTFSPA